MSRKIFVSYAFAEKEVARTLHSWFKPDGPCDGEPIFVYKADVEGANDIDRAIRDKMKDCKIALFLKSETVHSKPWINREAEIAISMGLPLVLMPLDDSPAGPPEKLRGRTDVYNVPKWSSNALCPVLNSIPVRSTT